MQLCLFRESEDVMPCTNRSAHMGSCAKQEKMTLASFARVASSRRDTTKSPMLEDDSAFEILTNEILVWAGAGSICEV